MKMQAAAGKMHLTDAANVEALFCIIRSIPSPKAEPFPYSLYKTVVKMSQIY